MAWVTLIVAGLLEIVWAFAMKQSQGFTRLTPTLITLIAMIGSFALLSLAMRSLPLGTAYTIWTGIGALGAFLVGIVFLGEAATALRLLAAMMILGGLVLMKLA
ncbi:MULTISPECIES: DMT family transporter [Sphingobium]|uniref:DMT family transporter n=1 Tax=Sphingobium TaxID=165695 RepID=UPI00159C5BF8|nr:SMR family transporter [Sphingobium sp. 15-1]